MILSHDLLHPTASHIQNPFCSLIETTETWLQHRYPSYLTADWPNIKYAFLKRILGLEQKGVQIRCWADASPSLDVKDALLQIYDLTNHSIYFTSKYWRSFYYWLKYEKLSECWPQFGEKEIMLALSLLTEEDLSLLRNKVQKEWASINDSAFISDLYRQVKTPLQKLCYTRSSTLSRKDSALYSPEDLFQHAQEAIVSALRRNDYLPKDPSRIVGWALKCADNSIQDLRKKAHAKKRKRAEEVELDAIVKNKLTVDVDPYTWFSHYVIEDRIILSELLVYADSKIGSYLRTICGGEHNPDFWSWFYLHEPELAQRTAYVEENPEALGPYLQRHLNLPTYQLTSFLKEYLPSLLDKVSNTAINRAKLAYVG